MTLEPGMYKVEDIIKLAKYLQNLKEEHIWISIKGEGTIYTPMGGGPMAVQFHTKNEIVTIKCDLEKHDTSPVITRTEKL